MVARACRCCRREIVRVGRLYQVHTKVLQTASSIHGSFSPVPIVHSGGGDIDGSVVYSPVHLVVMVLVSLVIGG